MAGTGYIASFLRIEADGIKPSTSPVALGLDTLMALQLRNRIARNTGLKIPTTVVWAYPTTTALATSLLNRIDPASQE
ncbi:acyl carrier protein [Streptomyces sp. NPDC087300]|uniref:acyl carrier protein n=1 Tax=Streptomyces sp. NPDC087300 TaxID=3365780 RepID=UPI0038293EC9